MKQTGNKQIVTIKITDRDTQHNRWWNDCLGFKYAAVERNGTMMELEDGSLIPKRFCQVIEAKRPLKKRLAHVRNMKRSAKAISHTESN